MTFGLIVGNRGFFPDHLAKSGREEMIAVLEKAGHSVAALTPEDTKYGAVETHTDAKKCADLFRANRDRIDGVIGGICLGAAVGLGFNFIESGEYMFVGLFVGGGDEPKPGVQVQPWGPERLDEHLLRLL